MRSNTGDFTDMFGFIRTRAAPYRDQAGAVQVAPANVPRLDHAPNGMPLGFLVQGYPDVLEADFVSLTYGVSEARGTVLHDFIDHTGIRTMRAYYTLNARSMLGALLGLRGWHRRIMAFPKWLPTQSPTQIAWNHETWTIVTALKAGDTAALDTGFEKPLLGAA